MENGNSKTNDCGCGTECCSSKKSNIWSKIIFIVVVVAAVAIVVVKLTNNNKSIPMGAGVTTEKTGNDNSSENKNCSKPCDMEKKSSCCPNAK